MPGRTIQELIIAEHWAVLILCSAFLIPGDNRYTPSLNGALPCFVTYCGFHVLDISLSEPGHRPKAAAPRSSKRDLHQQWLAPARCQILATQWPSGFVWKCHDMSGNGGAQNPLRFYGFRYCHEWSEWQHIRASPVLLIFGQAQVISSPLLG